MDFAELLFFGATAGLGATIFTDLFTFLRQGTKATHTFYCMVGRWIGSLPRQGIFHDDIRASPPVAGEAILGWSAHVILGIFFGISFALLFGASAFNAPQIWQGLSFGLATVLVPWLVFQPLFGWGLAMSNAPTPWRMRLKGMITHTVFGLGLWLCIAAMNALL
ncbi:putative membrane protein [Roseobacter sp. MED193]|uniref:DUF2938 family protein n=1 Tax=Roseobacter sp. MED193 TaxID=314262 RepID=UPI000068B942|nr:DUF2938 family protein [Roseobacter sp. MED193]EAQ47727.1 putative membrane protein [Roseobacter sp. MED193]